MNYSLSHQIIVPFPLAALIILFPAREGGGRESGLLARAVNETVRTDMSTQACCRVDLSLAGFLPARPPASLSLSLDALG